MKLHIYENKETLSNALASWMCEIISDTLQQQEYFTLVLSGGSTPQLLFKTLASEEFIDRIDWKKIHVFWGDERVVPFSDDRNNAKIACDLLLNKVPLPPDHLHIIRTDIEPNFSVDAYRKILHDFFDNTTTTFDLVLLGMGDDGHTLSLFPGSEIIEEHENWVNSVYLASQSMYRISLMPRVVNRAAKIAFMVTGKEKAVMVGNVLQGPYEPIKYPAQIIQSETGELHWFLDEGAASKLTKHGDGQ